ncbi:GNAT family N-acetyltransferase [soil metagenome]
MIVAETTQLIVRDFTTADTSFIIELVNTPSWIRYIGERNIKTDDDALAYLEKGPLKSYTENGFGLYCVDLKEGNVPIGMCGLIKRVTLEDVDVGFAFLPAYEGKGHAFESTAAVLSHAQKLGLKRIVAITLPDNEKSIKLLKKVNMHFERMIQFPNEKEELMLFSINF